MERTRRRILLAIAILFVLILTCYLALRLTPFPEFAAFQNRSYSTRVYDRNGILLQVLPLEDGLRREWYDLQDIPPRLIEAFIALEDKNFYRHGGVDIAAIIRAAQQNAQLRRQVSGASTITMQLARLVVRRKAGEPVTMAVKLGEAINALRLEARLSKDAILELYLNSVPFGNNIEGIGSASRSFFGLTPNQLDDEQMQTIALTPRRPASYSPLASGDVTHYAYPGEHYVYPFKMPHFVQYVVSQYAVLPPELRLSADSKLSAEVSRLIQIRLDEFRGSRISQGAAFVIDNNTGEILVWTGSGDFFGGKDGQIDGVLVKNQAGSSMKPFLYALALEKGIAPVTVLPDVPTDFGSSEIYVPLNFNDHFNGPVLLRTALASSFNVPAVYLLYRLGIDSYLQKLVSLGFVSLDGKRGSTGLSLALGSGEVTLFELVRAFSAFPRDGSLPDITWLKGDGANNNAQQVYSRDTARIICDILSDRRARSGGFGFADMLSPPYPAIFKTGTSNQFQDIVALGATMRYTAGVWMGNFSGETVVGKTGSSLPAEIVRRTLDMLTELDAASASFPLPEGYTKEPVCALSGMTPTNACPAITSEFVPRGLHYPPCNWHYRSGERVLTQYPAEYQRWVSGKNTDIALFWDSGNTLRFLYPADGAVFVYDPAIPLEAQQFSVDCIGGSEDHAALFCNGALIGESERPFSWTVPVIQSEMTLSVVCGDARSEIAVAVK